MKTDFFNINAVRRGCGNDCEINEGRPARGFRAKAVRVAVLILTALLITAAALPAVSVPAQAASAPELYGDAAVLINADTGEILYDKNRMRQMYPASTTKIMTVMLALENLDLDSRITVSADAEAQDGSELGLVAGEQITVKDAVYGTMLLSANDAAWALAEAVSGDVQSFAKLMNEKAADLGCLNTYFVTPNGLPNDSHVTSPMDMAKIAQAAMKDDTFREVVGTYQYTVSATNKSAPRPVTNTNRLLFDLSTVNVYGAERTFKYEGCTGVKTGHTNAAGYCLVASAERDGANLIGVVFHSTEAQLYPDMIKLLDFGFTGFAPKTIVKAGDVVGTAKVKYGSPGSVDVATEEDVVAMVEADAEGNPAGNLKGYSYTLNINEINAPVTKGTVAGTLTLYNGTDELGSFDLVATENVEMSAFHSLFKSGSWAKGYILMIGAVLVVSVLGYVGITFQMRRSARKQRNARRKRRMMKRIQEQRAEAAAKEAAALAAEREAEEAARRNETPVEEGDLSRMNLLGADEMPDFGEDDGQAAASIESVRASAASSPDRVSDLFSRIQAQQAENSGATGTTTARPTGSTATASRPAGTTATTARPAGTGTTTPTRPTGTTATPTRPAGTGTTAARPAGIGTTASRPVGTGTTASRPAGTAGTTASRPAGTGTTTARPAGTGTTPTRPAGTGTTASRPAGIGTTATRPARTGTTPTRPAGIGTTTARPAGTAGTTASRPAGTGTTTARPAGTGTTAARPAGTGTTTARPAGTGTTTARPAGTGTTTTRPAGITTTTTRPAGTGTTTSRPAGTTATTATHPAGTGTTPSRPAGTGTTTARPAGTGTTTARPAGSTATPSRPAGTTTTTARPVGTGTTTPTRPAGTTATPTRPAGTNPPNRPAGGGDR